MGDILGYARVSTGDQDVAGQTMRLEEAGAIKVFTDVMSGKSMERPGLAELIAYARRRIKIEHDRALYKERNHIERFFGRLKINRAIATRYDQLAKSFLSMVHIAAARYWLKFVHAA